jgi:ABC-type transporter Mla MlaB component
VTVRITLIADRPTRTIRVEGRLSSDEVAELEGLIGNDPAATCLELADLRSTDATGLAALRRFHAQGVALSDVLPHIALRMEAEGR